MDREEKHRILVEELVSLFERSALRILQADGVPGYPPTRPLRNDGYGDQEDKTPDVYAFDPEAEEFIIGEAKTGDGDLETEHALTQYNVYLDQTDTARGKHSRLIVILPPSAVAEFTALITHYIHPDYWDRLSLVSSTRCES
jgi:hypothetical protein